MLTLVPEDIERYAHEHTTAVPDLLEELTAETRARMEWWVMQVGRLEGTFLRLLARLVNAKRIVEVGMFTGYSGLCLAEGMGDDGRLVTCDIDPAAEEMARRYFARSPHGKKIEIRMGPALETLKNLGDFGPIDMAFIDADKENYVHYYEALLPMMRRGGLIVADNTLWSGRVLDPKDSSDHAIVAFNKHVASDPRVENALVTVRDGMMLIRKL